MLFKRLTSQKKNSKNEPKETSSTRNRSQGSLLLQDVVMEAVLTLPLHREKKRKTKSLLLVLTTISSSSCPIRSDLPTGRGIASPAITTHLHQSLSLKYLARKGSSISITPRRRPPSKIASPDAPALSSGASRGPRACWHAQSHDDHGTATRRVRIAEGAVGVPLICGGHREILIQRSSLLESSPNAHAAGL